MKPVITTANMANTEYFVRPATAPETMVAHAVSYTHLRAHETG